MTAVRGVTAILNRTFVADVACGGGGGRHPRLQPQKKRLLPRDRDAVISCCSTSATPSHRPPTTPASTAQYQTSASFHLIRSIRHHHDPQKAWSQVRPHRHSTPSTRTSSTPPEHSCPLALMRRLSRNAKTYWTPNAPASFETSRRPEAGRHRTQIQNATGVPAARKQVSNPRFHDALPNCTLGQQPRFA